MNTYALGNLTLIAFINKPPNLSGLTIEVCFSLMSQSMLRYLVDGLLCDIPGPRFFLSCGFSLETLPFIWQWRKEAIRKDMAS